MYPNNDPVMFMVAFYGCLLAEVIPVPIEVPLTRKVTLMELGGAMWDGNKSGHDSISQPPAAAWAALYHQGPLGAWDGISKWKNVLTRAVLSSWRWSILLNDAVFTSLLQIIYTEQILVWIYPLTDGKGLNPALLSSARL